MINLSYISYLSKMKKITFSFVILLGLFSCSSNSEPDDCDKFQVVDLKDFDYVDPWWYKDSLNWFKLNDRQWTNSYLRIDNSIYRLETTTHWLDGYYTDEGDYISSADLVDHDYCCIQLMYENVADQFMISTLGGYSKVNEKVYKYDPYEFIGEVSYTCFECDSITGIVQFNDDSLLGGVHAPTFNHISMGYSRDKNRYYHHDSVLTTASITDSFYYADIPDYIDQFVCIGNSVYRYGRVLADARTFHYDEDDPRNESRPILNAVFGEVTTAFEPKYILADKNKKWLYESEFGFMEEIPVDP